MSIIFFYLKYKTNSIHAYRIIYTLLSSGYILINFNLQLSLYCLLPPLTHAGFAGPGSGGLIWGVITSGYMGGIHLICLILTHSSSLHHLLYFSYYYLSCSLQFFLSLIIFNISLVFIISLLYHIILFYLLLIILFFLLLLFLLFILLLFILLLFFPLFYFFFLYLLSLLLTLYFVLLCLTIFLLMYYLLHHFILLLHII